MTTRAYQEIYLASAVSAMGEAFDYAVNDCKIPGDKFAKLFVGSKVCKRIENREPAYLAGKSGVEIVRECVKDTTGKEPMAKPQARPGRTSEYWCGWAVAHYQLFKAVSFDNLLCMYPTLHESDVNKFSDIMDEIMRKTFGKPE